MNAVAPLDIIEVQDFNFESECKGNLYLCIFLIYHNNKVKLQEEYRILVNLTRGLKFFSQFQIRDFEG